MIFERWNMGRFAWLPSVLVILTILIMIAGSYYVWHRWEYSRAFNTLAEENYEAALKHSDRLIAFGYDKDRARRFRALALAEIDPEQGIVELRELVNEADGEFQPDLHLRLAELLRETNQADELEELLETFPDGQSTNPRFLILKAALQIAEDNPSGAYQTLQDLLTLAPQHPEANLLQAQLLLSSSALTEKALAKVNLLKAAESMSDYGLQALVILSTDPRVPIFTDDRELLAEQLRKHPESTAQIRMLAATQELLSRPDDPEAVVERAIFEEGEKNKKLVANWLLQIGAPQRAVEFLTTGAGSRLPATINAELKLNAYLALNDFAAIRELMAAQGDVLPEDLRNSVVAVTNAVLAASDSGDPTPEWQEAYDLMREQENLGVVLMLADLAAQRGWIDVAQEAFEWSLEMSENPAQKLRIANILVRASAANKDSAGMLKASRQILAIDPNDVSAKNNQYYLEALLEDPPDADPDRFRELVERFPGQIFHSSYAFALWKNGDLEQAAAEHDLLDERHLENSSVSLVGSLIAFDTGNLAEARDLFDRVDPDNLLPEEAALYQDLATQLGVD